MSRRAVDVIARDRSAEGRQVIWDAILKQGAGWWKRGRLFDETIIARKTIASYVECLQAGGYVERRECEDGQPEFRLIKEAVPHAPRLRRDGTPVTQGLGTENMWRSMRMMKEFTNQEIAVHSTTDTVAVSEETAKAYCKFLLAAGYLRVIRKANPFKALKARYRLIRNDGPKPPMIQRVKQVFDPNTNRVYSAEGEE